VDMETVRATLEHLGFHDISDEMLAAYVEKLLEQHDVIVVEQKDAASSDEERDTEDAAAEQCSSAMKDAASSDEEKDTEDVAAEQCNSVISSPADQNYSSETYNTPRPSKDHTKERGFPITRATSPIHERVLEQKNAEVQPYSDKLDSCRDLIQEAREMLHRRDLIDLDLERRRRRSLKDREWSYQREMKDFSGESSPESTFHTYEAELGYEEEYVPRIAYRLSSKEIRLQERKNRRKKTAGFRSTDPVALAQKYREGWKRHGIR